MPTPFWMTAGFLAIVILALFAWRSRVVWQSFLIGVAIGIFAALFFYIKNFLSGSTYDLWIIAKTAVGGVFFGFFAEAIGLAGDLIHKLYVTNWFTRTIFYAVAFGFIGGSAYGLWRMFLAPDVTFSTLHQGLDWFLSHL